MKGIIFREFLEMVEQNHGYKTVDHIISNSTLESKGIYTSVGTYPHTELFELAASLSKSEGVDLTELFRAFGVKAFETFTKAYKNMFTGYTDAFDFLTDVEGNIHVEVLKLYPEAELPTFTIEKHTEKELILIYQSSRKMAPFAEGLMEGCFKHFGTSAEIQTTPVSEDKTKVRFRITKNE